MSWARGVLIVLWGASLAQSDDLAEQLRKLDPNVIAVEGADVTTKDRLRQMLANDVRERLREANRRETEVWRKIKTREEWEKYRDERIGKLKQSLGASWADSGEAFELKKPIESRTKREIQGERFRIENVVFKSRSGLDITANLYVPDPARESMPGILICPSHHNPKTQGELQDMGMTWARAGCLVLVMDNLGHGERRQHPFRTKEDYPGEFQVGRQDYYFRYNVAMQLHLIGESLIGYMAHDLMSGVDLLLSRWGIDKSRIILLGSVAGGGDPVGVTAALDSRIACVVPFNFGGPQPETKYPLPDDAEGTFNYVGGGSWESTRNLRLSARDGFLPWVIVGSVAPRKLIHAHEFSWDREHDPVWKRYQSIFGFYEAADNLSFTHGHGLLSGQAPEASHCNNIGPPHRKLIYKALKQWFEIEEPAEEYRNRRDSADLLCLKAGTGTSDGLRSVREHAERLADERRMKPIRDSVEESRFLPEKYRQNLQQTWSGHLGEVAPEPRPKVVEERTRPVGGAVVRPFVVYTEREVAVPCLLVVPERAAGRRLPVVVGVAQGGKAGFLRERSDVIAGLLKGQVAVCLADVRGAGETRPGDGWGRRSSATDISASELMCGQTLVGARLKDLRTLLVVLRNRPEIDPKRIALWGDSFAPVNPADRKVDVPLDAADVPDQCEPLGHLLALLGGLFEEEVAAVASAGGGLSGYRSVLGSPFVYVPHDAVVPDALMSGDLQNVAAALTPRPLWIGGVVDGLNRKLSGDDAWLSCEKVRHAYEVPPAKGRFAFRQEVEPGKELTDWLLQQLKN